MLKNLFVKDFVLIDECYLEFDRGFSAFTGETGAGKSLLIDAMCLLAGERASASFVKQNASKAIVEGTLEIEEGSAVSMILKEAGYPIGNRLTLRREIGHDGKSSVLINGRPATLALLKECVQHEIDIHSQHDTQYLLNKNSQLQLLDRFVKNELLIETVRQRYACLHQLEMEYQKALNTTYNENDLAFIQAEIDEIQTASLKAQEEEELILRQREIQQFEKTFQRLNEAVMLLEENDGVNEKLYQAVRSLSDLKGQRLEELHQCLLEHYNEVVDISEQLKDYIGEMEVSEEELNAIQGRLYEIQRLKRKYGPTIEAVLKRQEEMQQQIQLIVNRQAYMDQMESRIQKARAEFMEKAEELSVLRHQAALYLEKEIEKHCRDLMLPHARFVVDFQQSEGSASGIDDLEFYISMNPGEMPRPLARVASGGELSRLMLGMKTIFTRLQGIQTVIFDEIDTGVSGAVASAIGRKMKALSQDAQVFSVTHLAQVAACAQNHYLVKKKMTETSTTTEVVLLSPQLRIEQLALIASGTISPASLSAAEELLENSQKSRE